MKRPTFGPLYRRFENAVDAFPTDQPARPPAGFWPFVWHFTRPFGALIAACAVTAAIVAAMEVSLFAFLGSLVDWLATTERASIWREHGATMLVMALFVLVLIPLFKLLYEAIVHQGLMGNFAMRNRWQAHRYVLRQSMRFFEDDFAGRVATKVMQSALAVRDVVLKVSEVLLYVAFYFLSAVALIAYSDLRLSAPLLVWLGGYLLTMRYFVPRLAAISKAQADARSVVTGRIVDSYTNIATVKMFAHADREDAYAKDGMVGFLDTVYSQMRLVTLLTWVLNLLNGLMIFSVAGLAIWLWTHDAITTGAIAFSIGLCLRLQGMAHWILWEVAGLFENIGVVRDGIETIARDRQVVDAADAAPLEVSEGRVQFESVTFDYGRLRVDGGPPAVHELSLDIAPGERVGLVGRSGAGKSTIVNLLLRLYDVDSGQILIDGQNIAAIQQESLRAQIGMVTQDTSLLHRTVLDEATSALDSEVEEAIQEQLYNLMQGKTVIAIAHRLSTIAAMDRLVVIDAGSIVEIGTHQELLLGGGLYADLWARQSGGFIATSTEDTAAA